MIYLNLTRHLLDTNPVKFAELLLLKTFQTLNPIQTLLYVLAVKKNVLPVLSVAEVEMQETQRTDDSDSCHKPHDYYKR